MEIFKKVNKNIRYMNVEDFSDYTNCLYLNFVSPKEVNLFDYNTKEFIENIKIK